MKRAPQYAAPHMAANDAADQPSTARELPEAIFTVHEASTVEALGPAILQAMRTLLGGNSRQELPCAFVRDLHEPLKHLAAAQDREGVVPIDRDEINVLRGGDRVGDAWASGIKRGDR